VPQKMALPLKISVRVFKSKSTIILRLLGIPPTGTMKGKGWICLDAGSRLDSPSWCDGLPRDFASCGTRGE
jgi:hypothetical protein